MNKPLKSRNKALLELKGKKCQTCLNPAYKGYFAKEKPSTFFCRQFSCFQQWAQKQSLVEGEDY